MHEYEARITQGHIGFVSVWPVGRIAGFAIGLCESCWPSISRHVAQPVPGSNRRIWRLVTARRPPEVQTLIEKARPDFQGLAERRGKFLARDCVRAGRGVPAHADDGTLSSSALWAGVTSYDFVLFCSSRAVLRADHAPTGHFASLASGIATQS